MNLRPPGSRPGALARLSYILISVGVVRIELTRCPVPKTGGSPLAHTPRSRHWVTNRSLHKFFPAVGILPNGNNSVRTLPKITTKLSKTSFRQPLRWVRWAYLITFSSMELPTTTIFHQPFFMTFYCCFSLF